MLSKDILYVAAALFFAALLVRRRALRPPRPPGPAAYPLIGNLFDWPWEAGWLTFHQWAQKWGDIMYIEIFGLHIVILNSVELAQSLMSQAIYSDRPPLTMVGKLMGFTPSIVLSPYGEHWKAMRRLTQQSLNRASSLQFLPSQLYDARVLLQQLLDNPDKAIPNIRFALGKNIIENTYGIKVDSPNSEFVKLSRETHEVIQNAVIPGSFFVDIFPSLRFVPSWFPGAGFKRLANIARGRGKHMVDGAFDAAKQSLTGSDPLASLVGSLLSENPSEMSREEYEYIVKWAAGSLYGAGTESTVSGISTFLLMMTLHPDIQKKVQEEIDRVVGGGRLPTFEDRSALVFLDAVIKESLRFHPPTPLGIAHRLSEDDVVAGYHLPKGAIVLANIWGISMNEKYYPNPTQFDPARFLGDAQQLDPATHVFGFGRRACLGVHYSTAAIYITVVSILSVFDIRGEDNKGNPVKEAEFTGGFVSHPKPFKCRMVPRSPAASELAKSGTLLL
ncbi:cytochrome P450 [Auriscalpium vulgare]|uniref:Cytochrome P450 n=1 Tax=Auriscalpium vulgare TaxID=40419 RepID=A0ACB8RBB5_9AGAM|nr:cytochrome P450 [Auriscalpium vulgare]